MKHCCPIPTCSASFSRPYRLREHIDAHFSAKPYKCNICQTSFGRKDDLKSHEQEKHIVGARVQCLTRTADGLLQGCGKTFDRQRTLHRHLRREGANSCKQTNDEKSVILARKLMNDPLSMKLSREEIATFWKFIGPGYLHDSWNCYAEVWFAKASSPMHAAALTTAYDQAIQIAQAALALGHECLLLPCVLLLIAIDSHLGDLKAFQTHYEAMAKISRPPVSLRVSDFRTSLVSRWKSIGAIEEFKTGKLSTLFWRSVSSRRLNVGVMFSAPGNAIGDVGKLKVEKALYPVFFFGLF